MPNRNLSRPAHNVWPTEAAFFSPRRNRRSIVHSDSKANTGDTPEPQGVSPVQNNRIDRDERAISSRTFRGWP